MVRLRVGDWRIIFARDDQIETGKRTGSAKTLAALAKALQVTVDDLIMI